MPFTGHGGSSPPSDTGCNRGSGHRSGPLLFCRLAHGESSTPRPVNGSRHQPTTAGHYLLSPLRPRARGQRRQLSQWNGSAKAFAISEISFRRGSVEHSGELQPRSERGDQLPGRELTMGVVNRSMVRKSGALERAQVPRPHLSPGRTAPRHLLQKWVRCRSDR